MRSGKAVGHDLPLTKRIAQPEKLRARAPLFSSRNGLCFASDCSDNVGCACKFDSFFPANYRYRSLSELS
jgi:hypothetical protein